MEFEIDVLSPCDLFFFSLMKSDDVGAPTIGQHTPFEGQVKHSLAHLSVEMKQHSLHRKLSIFGFCITTRNFTEAWATSNLIMNLNRNRNPYATYSHALHNSYENKFNWISSTTMFCANIESIRVPFRCHICPHRLLYKPTGTWNRKCMKFILQTHENVARSRCLCYVWNAAGEGPKPKE